MSTALFLPDPSLAPDGTTVRAWREGDVADLVAAWQDEEMHRWMPESPHPFGVAEAHAYVEESNRQLGDGNAIALALADLATGRIVGSVTLTVWAPHHWNIGYWVVPAERGRGLARQAVERLSRWAFASYPGLERLSLYTLPGNVASQRVAERAGFRHEGVLRRWAGVGGTVHDWVMYSLIRADLA